MWVYKSGKSDQFSLIEQSYNLSGEKVAAGQVALSRMNEEEFPQSSLEFAMQKIKMDSNVALMTQAKDMSKRFIRYSGNKILPMMELTLLL